MDRRRASWQWERVVAEIDGKLSSNYVRRANALLAYSYAEIGSFPHLYHFEGRPCRSQPPVTDDMFKCRSGGYSALDFDNQGIRLASVTPHGCLTVHEYEALYRMSKSPSSTSEEDENKLLFHSGNLRQLSDVKWNPVDQNKVACTYMIHDELPIFDITQMSTSPIRVFKMEPPTIYDGLTLGLRSLAFPSLDDSTIFASGTDGIVHAWDRRMNDYPCMKLSTNSRKAINSIQLDAENRVVFGAGQLGILYMWDIRGGRSAQSPVVPQVAPLKSVKIASMLKEIEALKRRIITHPKEVHAIEFNPSCPYQLAFHLKDGCSGIVDINKLHVSHVHCPRPPISGEGGIWSGDSWSGDGFVKPSWLSKCSKYAVGSLLGSGIHLLDFHPSSSSAYHVDPEYWWDYSHTNEAKSNQNNFVDLSEEVMVCAAHPITDDIVVGTKASSLMVISQKQHSYKGEYHSMGA